MLVLADWSCDHFLTLQGKDVVVRKLIALSLVAVTLSFGAPASLLAQAAQVGTIAGEAVDAGGRGAASQRVELVQQGVVLQSTTTRLGGAYSFSNVAPGDYVVRVMIKGVPSGIRVSLTGTNAVTNATIVMPSAAAPSGPFLAPILIPLLIAGGVAATVTTVAIVTGS